MYKNSVSVPRIAFAPFVFLLAPLLLALPAAPQTPAGEQIGLRMISARTEVEAANVLREIQSGRSFEAMAKAHSTDASGKDGGFLGLFHLGDLKADLQHAVMELMPGQISPVTRVGGEFLIIQRLTVEEANWIPAYDSGLDAFQNARYEEAARDFLRSLPYAEKLVPVDSRLEDNLRGLAEAYRLQKKYTEAEPLYRRYLALHWGGAKIPEVLDRFSALLGLSYFRDSQFLEARRKFEEAVDAAPLGEELYAAMSTILFKAQLIAEAEALMDRAVQRFPNSRDVRYRSAELYRSGSKVRKALEIFEQIVQMKTLPDSDPEVNRLQQSIIYQKIGSIRADLVELDDAAAAYRKALEFTPDSVGARLGLGYVYLQQGRSADGLNEYNRAIATDPKSPPAYFGIADANLRMGRFPEAVAAAEKVLEFDPRYRQAHYVMGTALARMGQTGESDKEFEIFRQAEAEARSQMDHIRDLSVFNQEATAKMTDGQAEEAVQMLQTAIETFPDSATAFLNLGAAQSKLGQHKAAAETFQKMLTQNISDSFLVSWSLAREYQSLGDIEASRRHEVVYLQNVDLALREALESSLD
jgi:tetratricopeptide (TPR) repeat protein